MKQTKKDIDHLEVLSLKYNKLEKQLKATRKALKKKALKLIDAEVRCRSLEILIENSYWERRQKEKV